MIVTKTVKLEMTEEEKKAIKTVFHMLYGLEYDEERSLAYELGYSDLTPIRADLVNLYELSGACEVDLH